MCSLSLWERVRVRADVWLVASFVDPTKASLTPALSQRERELSRHHIF
jgi:hypothetical protein